MPHCDWGFTADAVRPFESLDGGGLAGIGTGQNGWGNVNWGHCFDTGAGNAANNLSECEKGSNMLKLHAITLPSPTAIVNSLCLAFTKNRH